MKNVKYFGFGVIFTLFAAIVAAVRFLNKLSRTYSAEKFFYPDLRRAVKNTFTDMLGFDPREKRSGRYARILLGLSCYSTY